MMRSIILPFLMLFPAVVFGQDSTPQTSCQQALGALSFEEQDQLLEAEERAVLKAIESQPAEQFLEIRRQMMASRHDGDFKYPIFEPVLKRMLLDLRHRLLEALDPEDLQVLKALVREGESLLKEGVLYKATMRFSFDYLHALDAIFIKRHPHLSGSFHRTHAEHVLEKMLDRGPDVLLYPSFRHIGLKFFSRTRGVPFHVIGLHPQGLREGEPIPFADGFFMKPSEFAWHDVGHIEFMAGRDFEYIDSSFKPLERIIQEWDLSRRHIMAFWESFSEQKDVYDAMGLILFEILHERGYQYSFAVLKAQLDTPKWTEILMRKLENDYYREFTKMNMKAFNHLETARNELLRFVAESRRKAQRQHITALWGEDLAVRVTHYPKVGYDRGQMERLEILPTGQVNLIARKPDGELIEASADDVILAQVSPTMDSPFDTNTMEKINALLDMKRPHWTRLVVLASKKLEIEYEDGGRVPLDSLFIPSSSRRVLEDRHFFQINQILGSAERGQPLSFTLHKPNEVYIGKVSYSVKSGEDMITIHDSHRGNVSIPLSEALVDPLQRSDFQATP